MNISLLQVLNAPLFENVKILSGRAGLGRIVKRASVFDAPFKEDVLEIFLSHLFCSFSRNQKN